MPEQAGLVKDYIGDGVYVKWDGLQLWLLANDYANPTDRVCLEVPQLKSLVAFAKTHKISYE